MLTTCLYYITGTDVRRVYIVAPRQSIYLSIYLLCRVILKRGKKKKKKNITCAKRRETSFTLLCWKGTSLSTISRVFVPIFFFGQSVVVDVEGVGFRPRAVVAGRGVVALCTRISSQEYVYDK